ncbi:hypothetical protein H8959_002334 [Pygathrix nigripes]
MSQLRITAPPEVDVELNLDRPTPFISQYHCMTMEVKPSSRMLALSVLASPSAKLVHLQSRPSICRLHADAGAACSGTGSLHHTGGALSAAVSGSRLDARPAIVAHLAAAERQQLPHTEATWRVIRPAAPASALLPLANQKSESAKPQPRSSSLASTGRQGTPMSGKEQGSDCLVYPGRRELALDSVVRGKGSLRPA